MTTVAQMIAWLSTLPQDAVVECGAEVIGSYSSSMVMKPVDIHECRVVDYTSAADCAAYLHKAGRQIVRLQSDE